MCLPVKPFQVEREWEWHGLKCAVVLAREQGHRCGYVRVPPGHPAWGKSVEDIDDFDVHGGITFARAEDCVEEDGRGWWVGFDCHHCYDQGYNPNVSSDYKWSSVEAREHHKHMLEEILVEFSKEHYWTCDEVAAECGKLAEQLAKSPRGEGKEHGGTCVVCGKQYWGYGNNADPVAEGLCCDECNWSRVLLARSKQFLRERRPS